MVKGSLMDSRIEWAELLIEARRFDEAEAILRGMADPHAYQLMRKSLALRAGRFRKKPGKTYEQWRTRVITAAVCAVVLAALVVAFAIIVYENSRPVSIYLGILF